MRVVLLSMILILMMSGLNSQQNVVDINHVILSRKIDELERKLKFRNVKVTVTAYSPSTDETDDSPYETASLLRPRPWTLAVSRDLFDNGWVHGKYVYLDQIGRFRILDLMNKRMSMTVDIFFTTKQQAKEFGVKYNVKAALLEI